MATVDRITKVQEMAGSRPCVKCGGKKFLVIKGQKVACPACNESGKDQLITK